MRKIVVGTLLSLDGVAEVPTTSGAQFWPSSQIEPFAAFINGNRLSDAEWLEKHANTITWLVLIAIGVHAFVGSNLLM